MTMAKKLRTGELEHRLLGYLQTKLGGPLDGYFGQNYDACSELIQRCKDHGSDPEPTITMLIDVATSKGCWHAKNVTNFRYLLNHGRAIANAHREQFAKPTKLASATEKLDDYLARRSALANGNAQ
jgi:hypothetical protein